MTTLEDNLNEWLESIGGLVNLTIEERDKVTQAGAKVLQENISKATKDAGHYNPDRDATKMKHLADSVEVGNLDGSKDDGNTAVGFDRKDANHARIARFLNDGLKSRKLRGDSFYDDARDSAHGDVVEAELKVLRKIQEGKGD